MTMTADDAMGVYKVALDETFRTLEYQERRLQNLRSRSAVALTATTAITSFLASESVDANAHGQWILVGIVLATIVMGVGAVSLASAFTFEFTADPTWYTAELEKGRSAAAIFEDVVSYWAVRITNHQRSHRLMTWWLNGAFGGLILLVIYWGAVLATAPGAVPEVSP